MKKNVVLMQHLIMAEPDGLYLLEVNSFFFGYFVIDDHELDSKLDMPIVLGFIRL